VLDVDRLATPRSKEGDVLSVGDVDALGHDNSLSLSMSSSAT